MLSPFPPPSLNCAILLNKYLVMAMFLKNMPTQVPDREILITQLTFNLNIQ